MVSVFRIIQIILGVLGTLLILGGDRLSMPLLLYAGVVCFGLLGIAIGWEAIITRQIVLGTRLRGTRETYAGIPAVLQGIQFNLIGLFLIGVTILVYLNSGREIFLQFVRRPGIPLVVIGTLMLLQALVMFLGYREINEGPGWMVTTNLLFSRMLPGVILTVIGFAALGLGLFEIAVPAVFDSLGGGFLEEMYGVR